MAPKLTPLLLDDSSNGYVDTWLQVDAVDVFVVVVAAAVAAGGGEGVRGGNRFFQHGRTNIIDCQAIELACARDGEAGKLAALETCRTQLVGAMREGNTLVIKMGGGGDGGVQFVEGGDSARCFVAADHLPSCVFEPAAVCDAAVWNMFVRAADRCRRSMHCTPLPPHVFPGFAVLKLRNADARSREAGSTLFAIRPGFNVVVTSTCEAKSYRRTLHKLLPLHRMRVIQVPAPNPGHCASRNAHTLCYASPVARAATVPHQGCLIIIEVFSHCYHH